MSGRAGLSTPQSSTTRSPLVAEYQRQSAESAIGQYRNAKYNVGRGTQRLLGKDDHFLRQQGNNDVLQWRGQFFQTDPRARPECDEHLAAIDRNRHGISEERWRKELARSSLRDFHASGVDEHLESLRSAWIDTPEEGTCPWRNGSGIRRSEIPGHSDYDPRLPAHWIPPPPAVKSRGPEPWAFRSTGWQGGQQALARGRLATLANLRERAVHGDPDYLYSSNQEQLPFVNASRPRTPSIPDAEQASYPVSVPIRNHHGKIIAHNPGPRPSLDFNECQKVTPRLPDNWDHWQRRWDRDHQRGTLWGWGKVAQRPASRSSSRPTRAGGQANLRTSVSAPELQAALEKAMATQEKHSCMPRNRTPMSMTSAKGTPVSARTTAPPSGAGSANSSNAGSPLHATSSKLLSPSNCKGMSLSHSGTPKARRPGSASRMAMSGSSSRPHSSASCRAMTPRRSIITKLHSLITNSG